MKTLVLGLNYSPDKIGIASYTTEMCEDLARMGHDVTVICGQPYYPAWIVPKEYRTWSIRRERLNGVVINRVPLYVPKHPTAFKRTVHHFSFALGALLASLKYLKANKPDIVFIVAPSLIAAPVGILSARKAAAISWLHIQDFEVGAALATGLLGGKRWLLKLAYWFERLVIRQSDYVSSISPGMCNRVARMGVPWERVVEFRNWCDVSIVKPLTEPSEFVREWNITTPHVALYSGNISKKQGIENVIAAAKLLRNRKDLTFVVCGQGPGRRLAEEAATGLTNIRFFDLQPKKRLGELLGLATIHLLPQRSMPDDLLLPSKLTNMLASGRCLVVTTECESALAGEVADCGLVVPTDSPPHLAQAIEKLIDNPKLRAEMGATARNRAVETWDRKEIIKSFESKLKSVVRIGSHSG